MWRRADNIATWNDGQLQASIDLERPDLGLSSLAFQGHALAGTSLLQFEPVSTGADRSMSLSDSYTRQSDLIASYVALDAQLSLTACWRMLPGAGTMAVELLLSVQTELNDSNPTVQVQCGVPASSCDVIREPGGGAVEEYRPSQQRDALVVRSGPSGSGLTFHLVDNPTAIAQLLQGSDIVEASLSGSAEERVVSRVVFFSGRVEKGVVRRVRMRTILAPADRAQGAITEQWLEMLAAPPPLAT